MNQYVARLGGVFSLLVVATVWTLAAPPRNSGSETLPDDAAASTPGDRSPSSSDEKKAAPEDITEQVEIQTVGKLRSDRYGDFYLGVTIRNRTDEPLEGRLVLVVDSTGIDDFKHTGTHGALDSGEDFLELQKDGMSLKPQARTPSLKLQFTPKGKLSNEAREQFSLVARVFRIAAEEEQDDEDEDVAYGEKLPGKSYSQADVDRVTGIQNKYTHELMRHPGVHGTATTEDENGNLAILVYTNRRGVIKELPADYDGIPLEQITTSPFRSGPAFSRVVSNDGKKYVLPSDEAADDDLAPIPEVEEQGPIVAEELKTNASIDSPIPFDAVRRDQRHRPSPIGISIFNRDLTQGCGHGTLGCRVVDPEGNLYILSNSHVMAASNSGAPNDAAMLGHRISQPGGGCGAVDSIVAELSDFQLIYTENSNRYFRNNQGELLTREERGDLIVNIIDASIARIGDFGGDPEEPLDPEDLVLACTPDDGYGFPNRKTKSPRLGMKVHKFGRTTGYTRATIRAVNTNVAVSVGTGNLIAYYEGQIHLVGETFNFGAPGDSGSLIVTREGNHPVGLLFAGGGSQVLANPIQLVLDRFNVAIDDGTSRPPRAANESGERSPNAGGGGRMGRAGGKPGL